MQVKTAALLGSGLAVLLVVLFGRLPGHGQWVTDLSNVAHGPAFALVAIIILSLASDPKRRPISLFAKYSAAIIGAIILGAAVEILQHFTGGDAESQDVWQNTLGALAGAGGFLMFDPEASISPQRQALRRTGMVSAVTACVLMFAPLSNTASAYLHRHRAFPVLYDFSWPLSSYFLGVYSPILVERDPLPPEMTGGGHGAIGLHINLQNHQEWWGVFLREPYRDWRGYDRLSFDLANPTDVPFLLKIVVLDRDQARIEGGGYIQQFEIAPHARQTFDVPLEYMTAPEKLRNVDISMINSIVLAWNPENKGKELYVMRIWLE
jgi:hypothetical protein